MPIIDLESDRPYKSMTKKWLQNEIIGAEVRIHGTTVFLTALRHEEECRGKERNGDLNGD